MAERYYVGGYWPARPEAAQLCAQRLAGYLADLASVDPLLASWYELGGSRKQALTRRIDPSFESLCERLSPTRHRRNQNSDTPADALGYAFSAWNGAEAEAGLSVCCGGYSRHVSNSVLINLPDPDGPGRSIYRRDTLAALLRATVARWEPAQATVTTGALRTAQALKGGQAVAGWATYLADSAQVHPERLPANATAQPLGTGTVILLDSEPLHTTAADVIAVRAAIDDLPLPEKAS